MGVGGDWRNCHSYISGLWYVFISLLCGSTPTLLLKVLVLWEICSRVKWRKGQIAEIYIGCHCYNQNNPLNANWSCCLLQFFSDPGILGPNLAGFKPFISSHVVQFSLVTTNPHLFYTLIWWTWLSLHDLHSTMTSACNDGPGLVPWMGSYSSFHSQLQSLLPGPSSSSLEVTSTLHWPPWRQWLCPPSLFACLWEDYQFLQGGTECPSLSPQQSVGTQKDFCTHGWNLPSEVAQVPLPETGWLKWHSLRVMRHFRVEAPHPDNTHIKTTLFRTHPKKTTFKDFILFHLTIRERINLASTTGWWSDSDTKLSQEWMVTATASLKCFSEGKIPHTQPFHNSKCLKIPMPLFSACGFNLPPP